jgi:TolB-like protein
MSDKQSLAWWLFSYATADGAAQGQVDDEVIGPAKSGRSTMDRMMAALVLVPLTMMAHSQPLPRTNISVFGIQAIGVSSELARSMQEHLEAGLMQFPNLNVLSRSDMDLVLSEGRLRLSGACTDEACLVEAGHILGVEKLVTGTVSRVGGTYNVVLKLIDIRSAALESAADRRHTGSPDQLFDVCDELLHQLLAAYRTVAPAAAGSASDTSALVAAAESPAAPVEVLPATANPHDVGAAVNTLTAAPVASPSAPSRLGKRVGLGALLILGAIAACLITVQVAH